MNSGPGGTKSGLRLARVFVLVSVLVVSWPRRVHDFLANHDELFPRAFSAGARVCRTPLPLLTPGQAEGRAGQTDAVAGPAISQLFQERLTRRPRHPSLH